MTAVLPSASRPSLSSLDGSSSSNLLHASNLSLPSQHSIDVNEEDVTITFNKGSSSGLGPSLNELQVLAISADITEVGYSISDVQTRIFEIQELRHQSEAQQANGATTGSESSTTAIDQALINLDERLEAIASSIASLDSMLAPVLNSKTPTNSSIGTTSNDPVSTLLRKHASLLTDWDAVQEEAETLKGELREDKWLAVFRTVGDQADAMMMSLEKAVGSCQDFIWTFQKMRRTGDDLSGVSSSSLGGERAVNFEVFQSLMSSYEAKKRYYMPATTKVLSILDRSVRDRVTKNGECLRRHAEARARWKNLRERINRIDQEMETVRMYFVTKDQQTEPEPSEAGSAISRQTSKSNITNKSNYLSTSSANRSRTGSSSGTPSAFSRSMSPFKRFASKVTASVRSSGTGGGKDTPSRGSSVSGAEISKPKPLRPINTTKDSSNSISSAGLPTGSSVASRGTSPPPPRPPPRSPFRPMGNKISTQSAVAGSAPEEAVVQEGKKKRESNLFPFLSRPPPPSALTRSTSRAPSRTSMSGGETSSSSSKPKWNGSTKVEHDDRAVAGANATVRATPQRPSITGHVFRPLTPTEQKEGRRSLSRAGERERPATSLAKHTPWNSVDNTTYTPARPSSRSQSRAGARTPSAGWYGTAPRTRPTTPSNIPAPVSYSSIHNGRSASRAGSVGLEMDRDDEFDMPTSLMAAVEGLERKTPEPKKRRPSNSMIPVPKLNIQTGSRPGTAMSMGWTSRSVSPTLSAEGLGSGRKSPKESPSAWRGARPEESPSDLRKAAGMRSQTPESVLKARAGGWLDHTPASGEKNATTTPPMTTPGSKRGAPSSFKGEGRTLMFGPGGGSTSRPGSRAGNTAGYGFGRMTPSLDNREYTPVKTDELDVEVAKVVNGMAHGFLFERIDPPRKTPAKAGEEIKAQYAMSNALGRKVITCRLVTVSRGGKENKKVMCRVGGGWLELSMYILNRQAGLS